MNEQLQQALLEFIQKANQGVNFAADQLPDALKETLQFAATSNLLCVLGFIGMALISLGLSRRCFAYHKREEEEAGMVFGWVFILVSILFLLPIGSYTLDWVQAVFYPKAWILEYVRHLR